MVAAAVSKISDNLSLIVDAKGILSTGVCAGHVDSGEAAAAVEEDVLCRVVHVKESNDLSRFVDASGIRKPEARDTCAGNIDGGEVAAAVHKAVYARGLLTDISDDLSRIVDATGPRERLAYSFTGEPLVASPSPAFSAPEALMMVKLPPLYKKPCVPVLSVNAPTI